MEIPDWLTTQPAAHRGLHNEKAGIIENSISAFEAAISAGYCIETDLQQASDGMPMVFHDDTLERLTHSEGDISDYSVADLKKISFRQTDDKMIDLQDLVQLINGRTPLLIELKTRWVENVEFPVRVAQIMKTYDGPFALMSFDHRLVAGIRKHLPGALRGFVASNFDQRWPHIDPITRLKLRYYYYVPFIKPHFIAHEVYGLTTLPPRLFRRFRGPVLSWTIRTDKNLAHARQHADNIIFEKIRP